MNSFLFDTCFLIDLKREMRRSPGKAHQFLQQNPTARPCLSWTVVGEFTEGFGDIRHLACALMLARFDIVCMNEDTAHHYAITTRLLRSQNQLIGANDHWIAAAALSHCMPPVTNNTNHFSRIPGLSVISY